MFRLGSHNTMSYLKPKLWFLKPFAWMAKCQSKDIEYQYILGIRYFDMRVRFDEEGNPEFAHGIMSYKGDVEDVFKWLNNQDEPIYIRLILELTKPSDGTQEVFFRTFCKKCVRKYKNLMFHCGRRKYDWEQIYHFKNKEPELDQQVSSMVGDKLDDIFIFYYALTHNKKAIKKGTTKNILLLDYIHIQ